MERADTWETSRQNPRRTDEWQPSGLYGGSDPQSGADHRLYAQRLCSGSGDDVCQPPRNSSADSPMPVIYLLANMS